jgi:hypothetical protein
MFRNSPRKADKKLTIEKEKKLKQKDMVNFDSITITNKVIWLLLLIY